MGLVVLATIATGGAALALAGIGTSAAAATAATATAATVASATVAAGLTVAGGSLIYAATSNNNSNYSGKTTYNDREKNERIEYEYYGNGNGNVHYELGHAKTELWKLTNGKETYFEVPKAIGKTIASNAKMEKAVVKGVNIVRTLAGLV